MHGAQVSFSFSRLRVSRNITAHNNTLCGSSTAIVVVVVVVVSAVQQILSEHLTAEHNQNSDVWSKIICYTSRHIPARVESRGGNVVSSDGKLQQLAVSFDDLVILTVIVRTESTVKTTIM